jgi:hypothetical protein
MIGVLGVLERLWREAIMTYFRYCSDIGLERLRKTTKNVRQVSRSLGRELGPELREHAAEG